MRDITEIACESYKEDLKTYDDKNYQIKYKKYDWKLSIIAYQIMIDEFTDYKNLGQPEEDYLAFEKESNGEVIDMISHIFRKYSLYLLTRNEYDNYSERKGMIKFFKEIYYGIKVSK